MKIFVSDRIVCITVFVGNESKQIWVYCKTASLLGTTSSLRVIIRPRPLSARYVRQDNFEMLACAAACVVLKKGF